jgi:hypothetical protein
MGSDFLIGHLQSHYAGKKHATGLYANLKPTKYGSRRELLLSMMGHLCMQSDR